jgi:hypothetical protein
MRYFVLEGILLFFLFQLLLTSHADNNHIDNEVEAVTFINKYISNTRAFVVNMNPDETETDCIAVQESVNLHEFRCVH